MRTMSLKQKLISVGIAANPRLVNLAVGFVIATIVTFVLGVASGEHMAYAKIEPQESFQN
jgi:hypothetical protein